MVSLEQFLVSPDTPIREVVSRIDHNGEGIALVVDPERRLLGTVTDGDIRRAILSGTDLNLPIQTVVAQRTAPVRPQGLTVPVDTPAPEIIRLMNQFSIRHIPLLDNKGRIADLALLSNLIKQTDLPVTTVVMAGGYGTRLRPLTHKVPKPLLPVGKRSILELIIRQLKKAGIRDINISTHYKAEKITKHFGNGKAFGVDLHYINENQPLGTAGALGLMAPSSKPILVINGDVLSKVNLRAMLDFHQEHKADLTVAVQKYDVQVSYGVIETKGFLVEKLTEKPNYLYFINAGIYLLEPSIHSLIPKKQHFDMTDLIQKLLDTKRRVVSFPIREYWLDLGNHADYQKARNDLANGELES